MKEEKIRKMVREGYAKIAKKETSCCVASPASCSAHRPLAGKSAKK